MDNKTMKNTDTNRSDGGSNNNGNDKKTAASAKIADDDQKRTKIDLLTSQLIDLCGFSGQKGGSDNNQSLSAKDLWTQHLEIRRLVEEIRDEQKDISPAVLSHHRQNDRYELLRLLEKWCVDTDKGFRANFVTIRPIGNEEKKEFGLIVEKSIDIGETAVLVPRRLFLSVENGMKFDGDRELKNAFESDPILKGMPNVALSLLLAVEKLKGPRSFWSIYIDSLPNSYAVPLYYLMGADGMAFAETLRCSAVVFEELLKLYRNIARQYAYFYQLISSNSPLFSSELLPIKGFVFDLYLWSAVTVMTRINFVPSLSSHNSEKEPALIPFFDMANHGPVMACTDFIDSDDGDLAVIYSSESYTQGDQLFIYYGERKFWEFFIYNGFINCDFPQAVMKLGISNGDRLLELKIRALQRYNLKPIEQFIVSGHSSSPILDAIEHFAFVFCAEENELLAFCQSNETTTTTQNYVWSAECREKSRQFLRTRLFLILKSYDGVIKSDKNDEKSDMHKRKAIAQKFLRCEADALKNAIAFLNLE